MELEREKYQTEIDGKRVDLYTIRNKNGMVVKATNWGAKVQQILVPDRRGVVGDVALGYDTIDALKAGQASMGAFIGRYANRIGQAKFTLDGQEYRLAANDGANSLHGGRKGSRFVVFDARQIDQASVEMTYVFRDGEENYPGTLPLRVIYRLTDADEFAIEYDAVAADKTTIAAGYGLQLLEAVDFLALAEPLPVADKLLSLLCLPRSTSVERADRIRHALGASDMGS